MYDIGSPLVLLSSYLTGGPSAQTHCIHNGWKPSLCQKVPGAEAGGTLTGLQQTG
jgi:hypothetical protein